MAGHTVFLIFLGIYLAVLAAIGVHCSRRQPTEDDFWLAGRRIGAVGTGFSAAASWITAGAMLAVIGFFMLSGMGSIWGFAAPNVLALLLIALLAGRIRRLPAITQPELLALRYGDGLRAPVAVLITGVMILFTVADIKGFAFVLQVYYGLNPVWAAVIVAAAVSFYVTLGGFSAVIWTDMVQFLFLAAFAVAMAVITVSAAMAGGGGPALSLGALLASPPEGWWNPLSIGLPMVLFFSMAIVPGWVGEQDPWQRVWAARSTAAARGGMALGAVLVLCIFAACAVIAISLNRLYPEIAALGFPAGMARAEPALLHFVRQGGHSEIFVALTAAGLAAAAMSCADTFATSGAACLSRDLYGRFLRPGASSVETLRASRISVLVIVAAATGASFAIDSIIEAIHVATFIASAAYFFPLVGGLFWPRATGRGAWAALIAGGGVQIVLVAVDMFNTAPMATPFLQRLHPALMGHGVLLGSLVSAAAFVSVSLATEPEPDHRLETFFPKRSG